MISVKTHSQFDEFSLNIDINFPSENIVGFFGPSGSGKSRLIRQMLGFDLEYTQSSRIQFNQTIWQESEHNHLMKPHLRGIGYLSQEVDLFPHLSVEKNIHYKLISSIPSEKKSVKSTSINKNASDKKRKHQLANNYLTLNDRERVYTQLDIRHLLNKMPHQLSGGQQQRVGLARAIFAATNLLLLDEPFSAIGEDHKPQAMQLLVFLQRKYKLTIIFSSHDRFEHAFLSQYLVTFDQGKISQHGNYNDISTDISGIFSQRNGAINRISAKVVKFEQDYSVNQLTTKRHKLWAGNSSLPPESCVNLEVRAQDISLFLDQSSQSSMLNTLEVKLIEFKEVSGHQIVVKLAFEDDFLIAFITKKSFISLNLQLEQVIYAKFKSVSVIPITVSQVE